MKDGRADYGCQRLLTSFRLLAIRFMTRDQGSRLAAPPQSQLRDAICVGFCSR